MPSMFERRFNNQSVPMLARTFGVEVTLSRGASVSAAITARRSEKIHTSMGAKYGIEIEAVMRNFIMPVASVVIDGVEAKPKRLDVIHETETGESFEVQSPDDKTPAVELIAGGYEWLVHTKKIKVGF